MVDKREIEPEPEARAEGGAEGGARAEGGAEGGARAEGGPSFFDSLQAERVLAGMSEDDREFYKNMGKKIYDTINFEIVTEGSDGKEVSLEEVAANVRSALKSGLRIEDLDEGELAAMRTFYDGESWKKEFE